MLMNVSKPVAKVVTVVLFGLLILSFAVWGIGDIFRGPGRATSVAVVGSVEIGEREFTRDLRQQLNQLQSRFGSRLTMEQAQALGLVEQVLQQMISRALFDQQAKDLGMTVTEDQIKGGIADERAFQNQFGDFDARRFDQLLRNLGLSEGGYVAMLSRDIKRQQIAGALSAVGTPPPVLAEQIFAYNQERRTAETILVETASFTDLPEPGEADLTSLHEEFSSQFMTPETRSLVLVQLRARDLAKEIAISDDDLKAEFEARREDYKVAELREVEQILFDSQEAAEAARVRFEAGTGFGTLAQETSGSAPIALGIQSEEALAAQAPELAEAAFSTDEGGVAEPVQTGFGWHLLHVLAVTPGREPSFEEVRDEIREDLAMEQAVDSLVSMANQLDDELAAGATLEAAAARLGVPVTSVAAIDSQGRDATGKSIEGLPPLDEFLPVLSETAIGEESLLTETRDGDYFVLRVDGVVPAEPKPLAAVRDEVATLWRARTREKMAREKAEAMMARAKEGVALGKVAEDEGLLAQRRGPYDRFGQAQDGSQASGDLASKLFELGKGELDVAQVDTGFMTVKLVEVARPRPSDEPEALKTIEEQLAAAMNGDLLTSFSLALRQTYDVTLNRAQIDDVVSRF